MPDLDRSDQQAEAQASHVRVVVVGASHAGLALARSILEHNATASIRVLPDGRLPLSPLAALSVTLVEPRSHEFFTPKIQSVLLGGPRANVLGDELGPTFGDGKVKIIRGIAHRIDRQTRTVFVTAAGGGSHELQLPYDRLVLATGSTHPSKPDPASFPDVLAYVDEAIVRRSQELARSSRVVIIGGGRAGVDLALGLSRSPGHAAVDVHLVHPGTHLLRPSSYRGDGSGLIPKLAGKVKGVEEAETITLHLEQRVTTVEEENEEHKSTVTLANGVVIDEVDTVVWATGASLSSHLYDGLPRDTVTGRLSVDSSLRLINGTKLVDNGRIFVLGDASNGNGRMRAKWAKTQGAWLGNALVDDAVGKGLGSYPNHGED